MRLSTTRMAFFLGLVLLASGHPSLTHLVAAEGRISLTVKENLGLARRRAPVTSGVPFPMGTLATNVPLQLFSASGAPWPLQNRVTATWRDGSVKWVLLDFPCDLAANESREFTLGWGKQSERQDWPQGLRVEESAAEWRVNTGPLQFSVARDRFGILEDATFIHPNGQRTAVLRSGLKQTVVLARDLAGVSTRILPPDEVVVEEAGPIRLVIRVGGSIDDGGTNRLLRYLFRVQAWAGSAEVEVQHTILQLHPGRKMVWVKDLSLELNPGARWAEQWQGAQASSPVLPLAAGRVDLAQLKESAFRITQAGKTNAGLRAQGWFQLSGPEGAMLVTIPDFWPQFPKVVSASAERCRLGLFPGEAGEDYDFDQGLAKTHRFRVRFLPAPLSPAQAARESESAEQPLFAQASPQWYCESKVFGDLAPFNFDLFPDYETLTEASGDRFIKSMATGWRNWGDVYYGGPYKGKNSYMNLEYDVPHNFLIQFARTGQGKYLDAARRMAQHQADIDVNHFTGWQWKHSPRHTEIQAEFGHTFTRGLLENYYLTGNRRTYEAAVKLGDFFTKQIRNPREMGNERQIGWGLISLLPVFEATWEPKYLEAVRQAVDRLAAEQEPGGKFRIRWDNRIAFFNGIAATGFIYYERATGEARAAEAALRTIRRTKGFYPEYAGRTLEALAWAYQRTRDPDYLDLLKLTYESTMERTIAWNVMELGAPTIFTAHTLPFLEQSGLVTRPKDPLNLTPAQFASENGLHVHHLPAGEGELYLNVQGAEPVQLVLIRKGAWKAEGTAQLYDPSGRLLKAWSFGREPKIWQRESWSFRPEQFGAHRLTLRSASVPNPRAGSYVTWDMATSRPLPAVFRTPDFAGLQFVTPYLFTQPKGDTDRIELELMGEGEGFKKAQILDPEGNLAGSMEAFIDLGDTGRYSYKLTAKIPPGQREGLWRLSLQDVSLVRMSGLVPCFSTSARAYFRPDGP